jgi:GTP-binding protein HflX
MKRENFSLEDWKNTYFNKISAPCVFISAKNRDNIEEFKEILFNMIKELHFKRYPYSQI